MPCSAFAIPQASENMGELLRRDDAFDENVKDLLEDHLSHDRLADSHCQLGSAGRGASENGAKDERLRSLCG